MGTNSRLRGQARRSRTALTGQHADAIEQERTHVKICAVCTRAGKDVFKRCDDGWGLAKLMLRTKRAVDRYDENHPDDQKGLF